MHEYSLFPDDFGQCFADSGGGLHHVDTGLCQRFHLVGRSALAAGDNGPGVTHAPPGRRGLAGDESDDGLLHVRLYIGGGGFFGRASDFADQDDGLGPGIFVEQLERVDVGGADDRDRRRCRSLWTARCRAG